jgi:hypothetical protein
MGKKVKIQKQIFFPHRSMARKLQAGSVRRKKLS